MNKGAIVGFLVLIGLLYYSVISSGEMSDFIEVASFAFVLGGTTCVTFIAFPFSNVINSIRVIKTVFVSRSFDQKKCISEIKDLASTASKKNSIISLDGLPVKDRVLNQGIQILVDYGARAGGLGFVRTRMQDEARSLHDRHIVGQNILDFMAQMFPAFGLIGTLTGLINMLKRLQDPSAIGPGMALALLTTFYGVILANAFCLPAKKRLEEHSKKEVDHYKIITKGILLIGQLKNPREIEDEMQAFLNPKMRKQGKEQRTDDSKTAAKKNEETV